MSFVRRWAIFALLALVCVSPTPARAWGTIGHEAVALIAQGLLEPKVREKVEAVLAAQDDPDGPATMVTAATWPDLLKHFTHQYDAWHEMAGDVDQPALIWPGDCGAQGCVVQAIRDQLTVLKDPKARSGDKAIAMRYLIHFVADAHQPLAVGGHRDDHGRKLQVDADGHTTDLFHLWDKDLVEQIDLSSANLADRLAAEITPAEKVSWGGNLEPLDWAQESFQLARQVAYGGLPEHRESHDIGDPTILTPAYLKQAGNAVRLQLEKAAVRLAALLNEYYR